MGDGLPEWTTEMDERILLFMSNGYLHTPSTLADRMDKIPESISRRLNSLSAGGLVKKEGRGQYRITEKGLKLWKESLGPAEFPDPSEFTRIPDISDEERIENLKREYELDQQYREKYGIGLKEYDTLWNREYTRLLENDHIDSKETQELATKNLEKRLLENSEE